MAQLGKFYTYNIYVNDVSLILDGSKKIYPSRYIAFNISQDIKTHINTVNGVSGTTEIDKRLNIRSKVYNELGDLINNNPRCIGDINFLSHDFYDGMAYSEIYIHISPTDILKSTNATISETSSIKTSIISNIGTTTGGVTGSSTFEFNAILVLYDVYSAASDATSEESILYKDLPMGIYKLNEAQRVIVESATTLYGDGTSWATRICSRFICNSLIGSSPVIVPAEESYQTMSKILARLGDAIESVNAIIGQNISELNDVKSSLDAFKQKQHINVPYLKGNHWYVNGSDLGPVITDTAAFMYAINKFFADPDNKTKYIDALKGDKGDTGDRGIGITEAYNQYAIVPIGTEISGNVAWETFNGSSIPNRKNTQVYTRICFKYGNNQEIFTPPVLIAQH